MHLLALAMVLLVTATAAQQPPCDLVPEEQLPNCRFTNRSNEALHGRVHTARVIRRELAPDPRTRGRNADKMPKFFIQAPGVWLVFSPDGDLIESAGRLSPDGSPVDPVRDIKLADGPNYVALSGTSADPEAFRMQRRFAPDGGLEEERAYQHGKLISRHVQKRDPDRHTMEDFIYDARGNLTSHSSEQLDSRGRMLECMVVDHDRVLLHERDNYDESNDRGDVSALTSQAWYDNDGSLFREIRLRNGKPTSWWQRPDCGQECVQQHSGVRFNFPFDYLVFYEFQPDGSLLTTIEHHKGRYGNVDNDDVELLDQDGKLLEKISYSYMRDQHGNWIERRVSVLDPASGQMVDVCVDKRDLTYY